MASARSRRSVLVRKAEARALRLLPASGEVAELVRNIERERRRPIRLLAMDASGGPSGMWVATEAADYIVYSSRCGVAERTVVVCHELAHMLLGHTGESDDSLAAMARTVAPTMDPDVATQMLARHGYSDECEIEAEALATLLTTRLARASRERRQDPVFDRLR